MAKVLVLGHGRYYLREHRKPRCAPLDINLWDELVTHNIPENLTFIDCDAAVEPSIITDVGDEWSVLLQHHGTYDYVIDAITHIAIPQRQSVHYWNGVLCALKDNGKYVGWKNACNNAPVYERRLLLNKQEVVEYVKPCPSSI